jgi:hypothetical protein
MPNNMPPQNMGMNQQYPQHPNQQLNNNYSNSNMFQHPSQNQMSSAQMPQILNVQPSI